MKKFLHCSKSDPYKIYNHHIINGVNFAIVKNS
jgi:hypothetical protein